MIGVVTPDGDAHCTLCNGSVSSWSAQDRNEGVALVASRQGLIGVAHMRCVANRALPAIPVAELTP